MQSSFFDLVACTLVHAEQVDKTDVGKAGGDFMLLIC